jgi:hypothetical protein
MVNKLAGVVFLLTVVGGLTVTNRPKSVPRARCYDRPVVDAPVVHRPTKTGWRVVSTRIIRSAPMPHYTPPGVSDEVRREREAQQKALERAVRPKGKNIDRAKRRI